MIPSARKIAETFSSGKFESAYPHIADDIKWTLTGDKVLQGKESVINFCEQTLKYFSEVRTKFKTTNIISDGDYIAINGTAEFINKENISTHISSCDIYRFKKGKLKEITSYCIVTKNEQS